MGASAMPKLPAVNPNITVMLMAEKAADPIKESADVTRGGGGAPVIDTRRSPGSMGALLAATFQMVFCGLRSGGSTPSSSSWWARPAPSCA